MQLWAKVTPNSNKFSVKIDGETAAIHATEEPERGRVNLEIIKEFQKRFGLKVRILRGATSRRKLLEIDGTEDGVREKLKEMR
jgi:uncharacterized protein (TIGR00251 family)